ncbi:glycosyltransferase family 4 protein [Pseudomonas sp. NPDC077649]|uniref:glycosyltransferase family 4 protein n=1 Tax=Pseudomonas sp. NPDC077649 TaxID=3364423 RepID=UPI0037C71AB7
MDKKWVAYVGPIKFPWGQAASKRVRGNAQAILELGYDVIVASGEKASPVQRLEETASGATLSWCGLGELRESGRSLGKLLHQLFFCGSRTAKWLDRQEKKPEFVIVYGGLSTFAWHVRRWCRANNVPVVIDLVEWYDPSQMLGGRFGPFYLSSCIAMNWVYPRFDGAITISTFLDSHFKKNYPTVIAPPLLQVPLSSIMQSMSGRLNLIYAGTPGKKDLLKDIILGVEEAVSLGRNVKLTILGPDCEEVKYLCGLDSLPSSVSVLGKVSQQEVEAYYRAADFSVILRESERFTNAGFPTKFVESLSFSTPVISNITSDLGMYLKDGVNGYVVSSVGVADISSVLCKAADLSGGEKSEMRKQALVTAIESFSPSSYSERFRSFFDRVGSSRSGRSDLL